EKTNIMISTKRDTITNNSRLIERIKEQLIELEGLKYDELDISHLEKQIISIKKDRTELNERNLMISSQIASLNLQNQNNNNLKDQIYGLKMCPTCLQDVNPVHKGNVVYRIEKDITENVKKINSFAFEKKAISEKLFNIENEISKFHEQINNYKVIKIKIEGANEKRNRIEEFKTSNLSFQKDIDLLDEHISLLKASIFELKKYENIFESKKPEFDLAFKEERAAEIKVAELKKEIDVSIEHIEELNNKISKTEEIRTQLIYISNLEDWLNKEFIPIISHIEKNVMVKLKTDFSKFFSEWFALLVPDVFNVKLDDEFTPIIEQQDYELDYSYLSGGERTAIALAYRLALNQVINSVLSKIKTKDLVILDEPTDGFSEQQLDKMRSILDELTVSQLIIVSHEQKIEGFVENVIRINKKDFSSEVS
ncbi:MAG TPA: hypothetical protein VJ438_06355, partial [Candidatus Nanoarchaeia archaeon]|nr:hypothetical protein [Candidatus Nanoarchaeia archaeon]